MGNCRSDHNNNLNGQIYIQSTRSRFNPFYQLNNQNNQQLAILNQFNFHSNYDDKFLGRCSILEHRQNKNFYLSKEIEINNQQEYQRKLNEYLIIQAKLNSQNIIQIKHIIEKQTDGFFTTKRKIILIVDYPLTNLQKQFNSRFVNKLDFTRQEIINILISCIKGYSLIEKQKPITNQDIFKNDKIRLKNIFFGIKNRDSLIKVAESSLLNEETNYQNIRRKQYNIPQNRDIYLSPQQFNSYINEQQQRFFEKAGVYSFGMSLLDICIMNSSQTAYLFTQRKMDFHQVRNKIMIAGKKYGPIVERFLNDMLEIDDKKRLSFSQLQQKIPSLLVSRINQGGSKLNLSIARSTTSYLRNDPRALKMSNKDSHEGSVRSRRTYSRKGSVQYSMAESVNKGLQNSRMSKNSRHSSRNKMRLRDQKVQPQDLDRVHQIYDRIMGRQYIGQKKGNVKHGQGRYQFARDGGYYQGQWKNNKMDGKGQTYYQQGKLQYSGEWKADQYHGWGILYSNPQSNFNWVSYQGQFKNGIKQGRGQMLFKNGLIYDGQFRGDKIHGRGKVILDGKVIKDDLWQLSNPQSFLRENKF